MGKGEPVLPREAWREGGFMALSRALALRLPAPIIYGRLGELRG